MSAYGRMGVWAYGRMGVWAYRRMDVSGRRPGRDRSLSDIAFSRASFLLSAGDVGSPRSVVTEAEDLS